MRRWLRSESGATSVEYALLAVVLAVGIVTSVTLTRTSLIGLFAQVSSGFNSR